MKSYLEEFHIQVLPHSLYSPDLSPCDFWLNSYIKFCQRGRKCETRSAVGSALYQCINSIPKEQLKMLFPNGFPVWKNVSRSMESTFKVSTSHYCKVPYFHSAQLQPLLKKCTSYSKNSLISSSTEPKGQ